MGQTVLVTGVSRHLGGRLAQRLCGLPGIDHVIGVDVVPPPHGLGSAEFVRADIRNSVIGRIIASTAINTVVHLGVIATPVQAGGRAAMKEINVIGSMQLLAACQRSDTVSRLVVKSTTSVYGAGPKDPAMFTEDTEPKHTPGSGWAKDSAEVEAYVRGFSRRRADVITTTLRFANLLGPRISTTTTGYFALPLIPTVLGHDARLQFLHEDDALDALMLAITGDCPGTFNVAGDGILALSQAIRRAGRMALPLPAPLLNPVGDWLRRSGWIDLSREQLRFLTYGRGVDTTRMRDELRFEPRYTTAATFDEFVAARGLDQHLPPDRYDELERALRRLLTGGFVPHVPTPHLPVPHRPGGPSPSAAGPSRG